MSYSAMHWARGIKTGSPTLKAVLMALANYADEEGCCWPSQKRLATDTELSERAVRNALANLEEMEIIDRQGRRGDKQTYRTDLIWLVFRPAAQDAGGDLTSGTSCRSPAASGAGQPAAPRAAKPITIEPPVEQPEETRAREPASSGWPRDAWDQFWTQYPHKVGKPAAQKSFTRIMRVGEHKFEDLVAGLRSYIKTKPADRPWLNPATFLNQGRWEDQPASTEQAQPVRKRGPAI